jgi:hypothetical protein
MIEYTIQSIKEGKYSVHKWDGGDMPITSYTVTTYNGLKCNCPSGKYRHYCKHTEFVKDFRRRERQSEPIESLMKVFYKEEMK